MTEPPSDAEAPAPTEVDPAEAAAAALRRATRSTPRATPRKTPVKPPSYSNDRDPQPIGRAVDDFFADLVGREPTLPPHLKDPNA